MWRTFWKEYNGTTQAVDEFLNSIEAIGFEPKFIRYATRNSVADPFIIYVTARKQD